MTNQEFIDQIAPLIQRYAKEYGYQVCSPIIAQACCESRYGRSGLAAYHNYFGLKCGSSWKGASVNMKTKEEYTPGTLTTIKDNFRAYPNMEEGVKGYFEFIKSKRYQNLHSATTPKQYLEMIKADGYATSSSYVNTNMAFISQNDLTRYDNPTEKPTKTTLPVLQKGDRGDYVRSWQMYLQTQGYPLASDGIFGKLTEATVKAWQDKNGLTPTGIITEKEWNKIGVYQ